MYVPSSVIKMLLSTNPPMPHRVSANIEINVTDDIRSSKRASIFEPAILIIVSHLYKLNLLSILLRTTPENRTYCTY